MAYVPSRSANQTTPTHGERVWYVPPAGSDEDGYWVDAGALNPPATYAEVPYGPGKAKVKADGTPFVGIQLNKALETARDYIPHVPTDEDRTHPKRYAATEFGRAGYSNVNASGGPVERWIVLVDADKGPDSWQRAIKAVTKAYADGFVPPVDPNAPKPSPKQTVAQMEQAREKADKDAAAAADR